MLRKLHNLTESIPPLFGRAPSCAWVEERLSACSDWDLAVRESRAVERHVAHCADCTQALAETEAIRHRIHDAVTCPKLAQFSPEVCRNRIMAQVDALERDRQRSSVPIWRQRPVQTPAFVVLLLTAATASFVYRSVTTNSQNDVVPAGAESASAPTVSDAELAKELLDIGIEEELAVEFDRALATLESEAALPHTDAELEAWGRKEHPHIMWLHSILREHHLHTGSWQDMLRRSGGLLCFDWPASKDEPNCKPSLAAIEAAANAVGYEVELASAGEFVLPVLPWSDAVGGQLRLHVRDGAGRRLSINRPRLPPMPDDYSGRLTEDPDLAKSVLTYLVVSSGLVGTPEFDRLTGTLRLLLGKQLMSREHADTCHGAGCTGTDEIGLALTEYQKLVLQHLDRY